MPTLLYGAENWILDKACLDLLERFQAEIEWRILRLNRYHSYLAVRIGLSLPSIASRILIQKLGYLLRLSSSKDVSIATNTFKTIACLNAYNLSLVKQCIFLDSKLKTNCTVQILNNMEDASSSLKAMKKTIISTDQNAKHQSVSQASEINWLRVWEAARDKGPYWTKISQSFYKLLTKPLFGERICQLCDSYIPEHTSFFCHLTPVHTSSHINICNLLDDLRSRDSDPNSTSIHIMRSFVIPLLSYT